VNVIKDKVPVPLPFERARLRQQARMMRERRPPRRRGIGNINHIMRTPSGAAHPAGGHSPSFTAS